MTKIKHKGLSVVGAKVAGTDITPEMLAKINVYALTPLTTEQIYVRKFLVAHNGIDRDRDRFPDDVLADFAATLPGKGFRCNGVGHPMYGSGGPGEGLWFDAATEELTPAKFKNLTTEPIKLPKGQKTVTVLWGWMYTLAANETMIANIEAGIYRHVSIGFRATDCNAVKDEVNGSTLYLEYVGPAEATEASMVWLGAQPGATSQKALFDDPEGGDASHLNDEREGGRKKMEQLLKMLKALGKSFTSEDDVFAGFKELMSAKEAAESRASKAEDALKQSETRVTELEGKVKEMEPQAKIGATYKEKMVDAYVAARAKLDADTHGTDDGKKALREIAVGMPITFLASEVETFTKQLHEKFPDEPQSVQGDPDKSRATQKDIEAAKKKAAQGDEYKGIFESEAGDKEGK